MSKSTHRTKTSIDDECEFEYGTRGFRKYVHKKAVYVTDDKKRIKSEALERRKRRCLE